MDKLVAKSKYSKKSHKDFYLFHLIYKSSSTYFLIILTLALVGLGIFNTISSLNSGKIINIIILWSLIVFTLSLTVVQMFSRINKTIKKEAETREDSIEVIEINKNIIIRRIENVSGREVIGWEEVNAIYETKNYIFVYTFSDEGFLIVKEDIIEGSVEGFRNLATNKLPKNRRGKVKYKIKYKDQ